MTEMKWLPTGGEPLEGGGEEKEENANLRRNKPSLQCTHPYTPCITYTYC